jgi:hypothetical protein
MAKARFVYEIEGVERDGRASIGYVAEADDDQEAVGIALEKARRWKCGVRVTRVPALNTSHVPSEFIWPGEIVLVAEFDADAALDSEACMRKWVNDKP